MPNKFADVDTTMGKFTIELVCIMYNAAAPRRDANTYCILYDAYYDYE